MLDNKLSEKKQKFLAMQRARLMQTGVKRSISDLSLENRFSLNTSKEDNASDLNDFIDINICTNYGLNPASYEDGVLTFKASKPLTDTQKAIVLASCKVQSNKVNQVRFTAWDVSEVSDSLKSKNKNRFKIQPLAAGLNDNPHNSSNIHNFIQTLFHDAINREASDIHLKRVKSKIHNTISYRVDGDGEQITILSEEAMSAVFARIKGIANLDISNNQTPQDGRTEFMHYGVKIDLRIATIPCIDGEKLTIRIIDPKKLTDAKEAFATYPDILFRLNKITSVTKGQGGLILVSGPTGSGKTTTLYSLIADMDRTALNVMTTEDPVEFLMPMVSQSQINILAGLDYPRLLRSQLRNDPDVLLVGEIRDNETADITVRASDTGHMVLASFHTDDAISTLSRFLSMMSPEFLAIGRRAVSHTLKGIINQKLARKLCHCAIKTHASHLSKEVRERFELSETDIIFKRSSCQTCDGTGYKGRTLIPEALFIEDKITTTDLTRSHIENNTLTKDYAHASPDIFYTDIIESCKKALLAGAIDTDEASRITGG